LTTNCKSGRPLKAALAALVLAGLLHATEPAKTSENDRLIQTAKLWIAIKYFHPFLAYKAIDWDKALVDALPNIRAAKNAQEYAAAIQSMLDVLHDRATQSYVEPNEIDTSMMRTSPGQRVWIHHGLTPESGSNDGPFYSAFVFAPANSSPTSVNISLGEGVGAVVTRAEGANASPDLIPAAKQDSYPADRYPSTEYRILAAYKIWGVVHHFFAYRDLMDEDWDDVFASFLPRLIAAKDAREYNLTVSDMLTHTLDSHVTATSDELSDYFGRASVGLRLRLIEKKPVITEILDTSAKVGGLRVGDIVSVVDGEKIADRFNRIQDYTPGSTPQRRGYDSLHRVLNGADGSTATLLVGTQDGPTKEIKLPRTVAFTTALQQPERTGDAIRTLPENIGYVDLTRLPDDQVPAVFQKLKSTTAIIFDARGETSPAVQTIASHLTSANDVAGAIITGPVTLSPDVPTALSLTSTASYFFVEKVPAPTEPKYGGKTVMLIDERTIGNAEHLGLWLEAANNTTFIGTPSAGADGATSNFVLPGGITITFSGQDVRHGNTGKLQRLGLQPNLLVAPTVNGIRQGRDEVLQKAVAYISPASEHRSRAANSLPSLH
jgi:C-terminal processing protease CtpA/Prc